MPLVVPGINNNSPSTTSQMNEWTNKLLGKKLHDTQSDQMTFAKKDLPKNTRVVQEGSFTTMDHVPDRLNVHVDKDGTVKNVKMG